MQHTKDYKPETDAYQHSWWFGNKFCIQRASDWRWAVDGKVKYVHYRYTEAVIKGARMGLHSLILGPFAFRYGFHFQ